MRARVLSFKMERTQGSAYMAGLLIKLILYNIKKWRNVNIIIVDNQNTDSEDKSTPTVCGNFGDFCWLFIIETNSNCL